jgi:hypothetical protein
LFNGKTNLGKFGISRSFAFTVNHIRVKFDFWGWQSPPGDWKKPDGIDLNTIAG